MDVVHEEAAGTGSDIEHQADDGNGTCPQYPANGEEQQVGQDDKQSRQADDQLH